MDLRTSRKVSTKSILDDYKTIIIISASHPDILLFDKANNAKLITVKKRHKNVVKINKHMALAEELKTSVEIEVSKESQEASWQVGAEMSTYKEENLRNWDLFSCLSNILGSSISYILVPIPRNFFLTLFCNDLTGKICFRL